MSEYFRQKYRNDDNFRAQKKEKSLSYQAAHRSIKKSAFTLTLQDRSALLGRMRRFERHFWLLKEQYDIGMHSYAFF